MSRWEWIVVDLVLCSKINISDLHVPHTQGNGTFQLLKSISRIIVPKYFVIC